MASVTLTGVLKSYAEVEVIHDVNLEIDDGEFVVFVGPSGCGKSTLLRMIAGLEDISGGDISIGDTVVNEVTPSKRGVAMVFQTYALYPHMTVYKNMAFGLKQAKLPDPEIDKRVRAAAEALHLAAHLARFGATNRPERPPELRCAHAPALLKQQLRSAARAAVGGHGSALAVAALTRADGLAPGTAVVLLVHLGLAPVDHADGSAHGTARARDRSDGGPRVAFGRIAD